LDETKLSVANSGKLTIPSGKILVLTNGAYTTAADPTYSLEGVEGAQVVVTGYLIILAKNGADKNFYNATGNFNGTDVSGVGGNPDYSMVTAASYEWAEDADGEGKPGWKQASAGKVVVIYNAPPVVGVTLTVDSSTMNDGHIINWKDPTAVTVTAGGITGTYVWEVDGDAPPTGAIASPVTNTYTLKPRDYSVGDHVLTVFVTTSDGVYTNSVTFEVE
jgi:hypothetical protein